MAAEHAGASQSRPFKGVTASFARSDRSGGLLFYRRTLNHGVNAYYGRYKGHRVH